VNIAIVHDFFCNLGGSDAVVQALHQLFPDAPVYTLIVYDRNRDADVLQGMELRFSFLQRIPWARRSHQPFLPLFPIAVEQFDLRDYDLIISSSHSCAKGIITPPETLHICYCHTPMRYAWDMYPEYTRHMGRLARAVAALVMHYVRLWDALSTARVDHFVANSRFVARRIWKYYRCEATVIYPPVDTTYFTPEACAEVPPEPCPELRRRDGEGLGRSNQDEDYYLVVSRLTGYKRVDLAVAAFNDLRRPLRIIGHGPELRRLQAMAGPNIAFLGYQPRSVVREHLARCRALIFPGVEDFGIAPVEAQAAGRPVIAYAAGGALETVVDGVTGLFFREQSPAALGATVERFEHTAFDKQLIHEHARQFDAARFAEQMRALVVARS
jgi:glycosyltransferase involved in cell wall biosynthesis